MEVKWSDRVTSDRSEIKGLIKFLETNRLKNAVVTTKTKRGTFSVRNFPVEFVPSSEQVFAVGKNLISANM